MSRRVTEAVRLLRGNPSLAELRKAYPTEWQAVERDIDRLIAARDPGAVRQYLRTLSQSAPSTPGRRRPSQQLASAAIRKRMAAEALNQAYLAATTGTTGGCIRFNLVNGYVAQKLLFRRDLERKPVSMAWFRLIWPLLWQRRLLMPLVTKKGIYCFYSGRLVAALADLVGDRPCLEIAAGDGTLSRFLAARGVQITATDDCSWQQYIHYPDSVVRQDAGAALRTRAPRVVICSWPPAGNTFERQVFATPSVELYIVIASDDETNAGDWDAYRLQQGFEFTRDATLSRLVLPAEIAPAVYVFRRTIGASHLGDHGASRPPQPSPR